jgi:hypothetical protein
MLRAVLAADTRQRTDERQGSAPPVTALSGQPVTDGPQLEASIAQIKAAAREQVTSINRSSQDLHSGNAVARGFNSFVNVFSHKQDKLETQRQNAVRALNSTLPKDLETFHQMITAAGDDPVKQRAATDFLQKTLDRTQSAVDSYNERAVDLSKSNKFWSGIAADTIAGVGVAVGVGLCLTGAGATVGAPLIAASFAAGGALSLGGHALLDNQFDFRKEGLTTFVIGGLSGAATALTAGASNAVAGQISAGAAKVFGAQAVKGAVVQGTIMAAARGVTQGVVSATISGAQQVAEEHATGYQAGSGKRIAKAMGVGALGGFVGGALWSGVSTIADAAVPAAMKHLPSSLANSITKAGESRLGSVAWNTLSGAFYGGPVGAAGTAVAAWMTGEKLSKEEFWNQFIAGAINGAAVYGTWAATPGGRIDLEASGSYALDKPGSRTPNLRRLKVTVADQRNLSRTKQQAQSKGQVTALTHPGSQPKKPTGTPPSRTKHRSTSTTPRTRTVPLPAGGTRPSPMRQRIAILPARPPAASSDPGHQESLATSP